eukprot:TRINITY_DN1630_c0_g6_i1.p1 TRINITY_DN1630_c0_g6~~TRINITY_DN1630_c0_g6_i1.p1  ORF type:complete len:442 (-),score=94.35 TRINITY_DN1630_c0_g6_i1:191-1516(-)
MSHNGEARQAASQEPGTPKKVRIGELMEDDLKDVTSPGHESQASTAAPSEVDSETQLADEVKSKWNAQKPSNIVLVAGVVLASCAGFVNATAMLTCGTLVGHVTGTTAKLGMALEGYYTDAGDEHKIYQAFFLLFSFLLGSTICGLLVARNEVHFGKSAYGLALFLNSLLLVTAVGVFHCEVPEGAPAYLASNWISAYLLSTACGLQNGMCTAHFGAVVRTTHLTGLFTDKGLTLGRLASIFIRARCNKRNLRPLDWAEVSVDLKKLTVFTCLLWGYIFGVCIGATMADLLGIEALFIPATVTGAGGLMYTIARGARCRCQAKDDEGDEMAREFCEAEEIFERARNQIGDWRTGKSGQTQSFEELDEEVGKALNLLHDMETCLNKKLERRKTLTFGARNSQAGNDKDLVVPMPSLAMTENVTKQGSTTRKRSKEKAMADAA